MEQKSERELQNVPFEKEEIKEAPNGKTDENLPLIADKKGSRLQSKLKKEKKKKSNVQADLSLFNRFFNRMEEGINSSSYSLSLRQYQQYLNTQNVFFRTLLGFDLQSILSRSTLFPFLKLEQYQNPPNPILIGDSPRLWIRGHALPLPRAISSKSFITQFLKGLQWGITSFWPTALFVVLLHDFISFYADFEDRYGNTLAKLFSGTSTNQQTWSTEWGSDDVNDYNNWVWLIFLSMSPLVAGLTNWLRSRSELSTDQEIEQLICFLRDEYTPSLWSDIVQWFLPHAFLLDKSLKHVLSRAEWRILWDYEVSSEQALELFEEVIKIAKDGHALSQLQALEILSNIANSFDEKNLGNLESYLNNDLSYLRVIRSKSLSALKEVSQQAALKSLSAYLKANFALARSGHANHKGWYLPASLKIFIYSTFVAYSVFRFGEVWVSKFQNADEYLKQKEACKNEHKQDVYLKQSDRYACTECSDWLPGIFFRDIFSSQKCLDYFLSKPQNQSAIGDAFDRFLHKPTFKEINLPQEISGWSEPDMQSFTDRLIDSPLKSLDAFNIPRPVLNSRWKEDGKMKILAELFKRIPTQRIDFRNQNIGPEMVKVLMQAINGMPVKYIDLSGNGLGDEGINEIAKILPSTPVDVLILEDNEISDYGLEQLAAGIVNKTMSLIDVSGNKCTGPGIAPLISAGRNVAQFDFSDMNLSNADLKQVGEALSDHSQVKTLIFDSCQLSDDQIIPFAPYIVNANLNLLDLTNNSLTDDGVITCISNLRNSTVEGIILGGNAITNAGMPIIGGFLVDTNVTRLEIPDCLFDDVGFSGFVKWWPQLHLRVFNAAKNLLQDDSFLELADAMSNSTCPVLERIIMSDNLGTDGGIVPLITELAKNPIRQINFRNNRAITSITAQALADKLPEMKQLDSIDLGQTSVNNTGGNSLIRKLADTKLTEFRIDYTDLDEDAGCILADQLITSIPNKDRLGNLVIGRDLARALYDDAKPQAPIETLGIQSIGMSEKCQIKICRVLPYSTVTFNKNMLAGNPKGSSVNQENCDISPAMPLRPPAIFKAIKETHEYFKEKFNQAYQYFWQGTEEKQSHSDISDENIAKLSQMLSQTPIESLVCSIDGISDESARILAAQIQATKLQSIDLSGNNLGDEGIEALQAILDHPNKDANINHDQTSSASRLNPYTSLTLSGVVYAGYYLIHLYDHYSHLIFPSKKIHEASVEEMNLLQQIQKRLLICSRNFTSQQQSRAGQLGIFEDKMDYCEKNIRELQRITEITLDYQLINSTTLTLLTDKLDRIENIIHEISAQNKTLKKFAVKERRMERRNAKTGQQDVVITHHDYVTGNLKQEIVKGINQSIEYVSRCLMWSPEKQETPLSSLIGVEQKKELEQSSACRLSLGARI